MIKNNNRVKHHEEFQKIICSRNIEKNNAFVVYYTLSDNENARVGISVSKKLGNAVARNKIKRQVRHMLHETMDLSRNVDVIVIVRSNYQKNTFSENLHLLEQLLKRVWRKIDEQNKKVA